ncbi:MAG: hypothetical protein O7F16_03340 [Acidobacteria bacterium]|nr:hypothetical protein [Acidobacteriota bacterium]
MDLRRKVQTIAPEVGRRADSGHLLIGLMVAVTIMTIMVTMAAEKWSVILRRDREEELVFRGKQYAQALAEYQKEHGALPNEFEMLLKKGPRNHRYIRKLFRDPFTKNGEWAKLVLAPGGQAVVNPVTMEMRPVSMLRRQGQVAAAGARAQPRALGPQTPEEFGLRSPRQSTRFPGRGQRRAQPPGGSMFSSSVTQISPFRPEQLVNAPIAGVASANLKEKAFKMYEGYDRIRDFWFTAYEFAPPPATTGGGEAGFMPGGIGPGGRIRAPGEIRQRRQRGASRGRGRQNSGRPR